MYLSSVTRTPLEYSRNGNIMGDVEVRHLRKNGILVEHLISYTILLRVKVRDVLVEPFDCLRESPQLSMDSLGSWIKERRTEPYGLTLIHSPAFAYYIQYNKCTISCPVAPSVMSPHWAVQNTRLLSRVTYFTQEYFVKIYDPPAGHMLYQSYKGTCLGSIVD